VQDALLDVCRWWMERGVDGFRLDALNHCIHDAELRDNPPLEGFNRNQQSGRQTHPYYWQRHLYDKTQPEMIPFIQRLRKLTDEYPDRFMVAEIGDDNQVETSVAYTKDSSMLHTAYNFALLGPDVYNTKTLRAVVEDYMKQPGDSWPSWAFGNHDTVRVASRWAVNNQPDTQQAKMLIALVSSLRGTAFMYQGDELGLTEADIPFELLQDPFGIFLWPEDKGRDGCRTPFPWDSKKANAGFSTAERTWLPVPMEHLGKSVADAEHDGHSVLHFTRHYLKWRKSLPALMHGDIKFIDTPEHVLGFIRHHDSGDILCCFNLGDKAADVTLPSVTTAVEDHGLDYTVDGTNLHLPAFGAYFGRVHG